MFEISWEGKVNLPSITVSNNYPVPLSVILRLQYLAWTELFCLARGFYNKTTTRGSRFLIHVTWQNLIFVTSYLKGDICGTGNECYQHDDKPKKRNYGSFSIIEPFIFWFESGPVTLTTNPCSFTDRRMRSMNWLGFLHLLRELYYREQHSFVCGLVCSSCVSAEIKVQLVITVKYLVFIHTHTIIPAGGGTLLPGKLYDFVRYNW